MEEHLEVERAPGAPQHPLCIPSGFTSLTSICHMDDISSPQAECPVLVTSPFDLYQVPRDGEVLPIYLIMMANSSSLKSPPLENIQ